MGTPRCSYVMVMAVVTHTLLVSASASLLSDCRSQCQEERELKAACSERRNCNALLPDLGAFVDCLEPCADVGNNCFQRCAFKTDRISAICSRRCRIGGSSSHPAIPIPGDVGRSGAQGGGAGEDEAGSLCYKFCYDSLLNAAMNRVYRKRP
ncbi:hypothetical protein ACOMHN_030412 [Nucella lapillus]